ncbi:hypothetical protein K461DRAFT_321998 [Myriangium duriaei CBS 260.36]|uniref:Rhodopsin domain-containing protein n=1 Tax=Myriangium duriaei CBS 260.36 TaxID=1168546 RepID=A0A9P4IYB3_9PEZI|nr:hypothetical protein K461DRAFT_321998 [Myriangium duriaei CBS 260.36]
MSSNDTSPSSSVPELDSGLRLLVVASFMTVTSLSFTSIRLVIRRPWKALLWYDDAFNVLAATFGVIYMITCIAAVHDGLGKHNESPPWDRLNQMRSAYYASNVMFVLALASAQLSVGFLLLKVLATCDQQKYKILLLQIKSIFAIVTIWTITGTGIFTWPAGHMIPNKVDAQAKAFLGVEIVNLCLDLGLSTASYLLFSSLQISKWKKLGLVAGISIRVLFHAFAIPHYFSLLHAGIVEAPAHDLAWSAIWASLQLHLLIVGAALPCFSPFFKSMNGGIVAATVLAGDTPSQTRSPLSSRARKLTGTSGDIALLTQKSDKSDFTGQFEWDVEMPELRVSGQSSRTIA